MEKRAPDAPSDHRARILEAATEAILKNGIENTSTAEIASRAKVSKRELYIHFQDKRDILAAVVTELQTDIQSQANVKWSSAGDVREVLIQAGIEILRFIHSERFAKLFRIVAAESFHDPVSSRKFYLLGPAIGRKHTAAYLKRQMAAGHLRTADALQAADDFLDMLVSSRFLTAIVLGQKRRHQKPQRQAEHAVDLFLSYYRKKTTSRPTRQPKRERGSSKSQPPKQSS